YSDAEIVEHLSSRAPDKFKAAADAGYSSTEILDHFAKPADAPVTASGTAQAVGEGLRSGTEGLIGLPGDVQSLSDSSYNPFNWLTKKALQLLGPKWITDSQRNASRVGLAEGMSGETRLPTTADVSNATGKLLDHYQPQNETERVTQNVSSFI